MKNWRRTVLIVAILLSVCFTSVSFAEESALPTETTSSELAAATEQAPANPEITEAPTAAEQPSDTMENNHESVSTDESTILPTLEPSMTDAATNEPTAAPEVATPDPTAEPTATANPTDNPAASEAPTNTPAATATTAATESPVTRSVSIDMKVPDHLKMGDTVVLTATLNGFDGLKVALQWQYTKDGETWFDADGAGCDSLVYRFQVSDETAGTAWRLAVTIL